MCLLILAEIKCISLIQLIIDIIGQNRNRSNGSRTDFAKVITASFGLKYEISGIRNQTYFNIFY
jgi:hypothetical protein